MLFHSILLQLFKDFKKSLIQLLGNYWACHNILNDDVLFQEECSLWVCLRSQEKSFNPINRLDWGVWLLTLLWLDLLSMRFIILAAVSKTDLGSFIYFSKTTTVLFSHLGPFVRLIVIQCSASSALKLPSMVSFINK